MSAAQASDSRRLKVLVGGGLGLAVVLFLVTKVLGGGGGEVSVESTPPPTTATAAAPAGAPAAGATAPAEGAAPASAPTGDTPVETFEVFSTKNPFRPLRTAKAAASAPSNSGATAPAPAPTPAPIITPVSVNPIISAGQTATAPQATEPARTNKVALVDIFVEGERVVANVRVNDTVSKVGAGDSFSGNFRVVSLDAAESCGRFLYGDDQFRLCKGEEILK